MLFNFFLQPMRGDEDEHCASTSLISPLVQHRDQGFSRPVCHLRREPKGHTWLLCFGVHVLRFLDRCIHGNSTMNGPFRKTSTPASNTSQQTHSWFILHHLCVKKPLMSQRLNENSSCHHSTQHYVILTQTVNHSLISWSLCCCACYPRANILINEECF